MMSAKPHIPAPTRKTLADARLRREFLQEQLSIADLEARTRQLDQHSKLVESIYYDDFGTNLWDRVFSQNDPAAYGGRIVPSQPSDRQHGGLWPIWRNQEELDQYRQKSRLLCATNSYAKGLCRNLVNYTIGKGFTYKAQAKDQKDKNQQQPGIQHDRFVEKLCADTQIVVDVFCKDNRWNCAGDPFKTRVQNNTREREICRRTHRDGDTFLRLFFLGESKMQVRYIEPEQIRNPATGTYQDGWSYGIQHKMQPIEDVEDIVGYYVFYQDPSTAPDPANVLGEFIPAEEIIHIKNVDEDATTKRGTPSFTYDTLAALERASKLQRNVSIGAAIRAATAEVWKHSTATQTQLSSMATGLAEKQVTNPITNRLENIERIQPGTIRRVGEGYEPVTPPVSYGVPESIQAVQGDLRQAGTAFSAPEYIASGDASNANYASTREAGTPFVLACETDQEHFKAAFLAVVWRAVRYAVECGKLHPAALDLIEIQVEAPSVERRDPLQKAQEDQILQALGKSQQTILMERGLDPAVEIANAQEWQDKVGSGMPGLPTMPGEDGGQGVPGMIPGMESLEWDESKHKRDHGKFSSTGGGGGKEKPKPSPNKDAADKSKFVGAKVGAKVHAHAEGVKNTIAKMTGGVPEEKVADVAGQKDKKPFDVRVTIGKQNHDIEVKSMTVGGKQAISVHEDALMRKVEHAARTGSLFHTVVVDDRETFNDGANKDNFSGHRLYYKRGSGRYPLSKMHPVKDEKELRRLIAAPDDKLPEAARGELPPPPPVDELKAKAEAAHASRSSRDKARKDRNKDLLREQARARAAKLKGAA